MDTPLNLMSYDVNVALDAFERLYRQFKDNVRCTFSCEKSDLLERLSAFPSPSAAMCALMKELREEDDVVSILNAKVPVYTRYIMEAVKFVHESTTKRTILGRPTDEK